MTSNLRRETDRKKTVLQAVRDRPSLTTSQLSLHVGMNRNCIERVLWELQARGLVHAVSAHRGSKKRLWEPGPPLQRSRRLKGRSISDVLIELRLEGQE